MATAKTKTKAARAPQPAAASRTAKPKRVSAKALAPVASMLAKPAIPPAKPASQAPAKAASQPAAAKPAKPKKPKLVRDSFTIPKAEYGVLEELKQRGGKLGSQAKKSELLRAGIKALAAMPDTAFLAALQAVPAIKTGRPTKT